MITLKKKNNVGIYAGVIIVFVPLTYYRFSPICYYTQNILIGSDKVYFLFVVQFCFIVFMFVFQPLMVWSEQRYERKKKPGCLGVVSRHEPHPKKKPLHKRQPRYPARVSLVMNLFAQIYQQLEHRVCRRQWRPHHVFLPQKKSQTSLPPPPLQPQKSKANASDVREHWRRQEKRKRRYGVSPQFMFFSVPSHLLWHWQGCT